MSTGDPSKAFGPKGAFVGLWEGAAGSPRNIAETLVTATPYIFAGLEIAMIFALIGAIVAEFVGAQAGLGMLIQSMNFTMDVAGQFSVLLLLSMIGLTLNWIVAAVRQRVLFWDASQKFNTDAANKELV